MTSEEQGVILNITSFKQGGESRSRREEKDQKVAGFWSGLFWLFPLISGPPTGGWLSRFSFTHQSFKYSSIPSSSLAIHATRATITPKSENKRKRKGEGKETTPFIVWEPLSQRKVKIYQRSSALYLFLDNSERK